MTFLKVVSSLISSILLFNSVSLAFETDQFNLPKVALADIGVEVSEHVIESLRTAVASVNADIAKSEACVAVKTKSCDSPEKERAKLVSLRSGDAVADAFSRLIAGGNFITTKFGKWMNSHEFRLQPARYKAAYAESIYILNPIDYATLSPTIRMDGHEFGIDKLEHLFQQGHQYFEIYNAAIKQGSTKEEATAKAIGWGQKTERTYYGLWGSGVYSNADLFANYVGMKFYQGLASPVKIGEDEKPPVVVLKDGRWKMGESLLLENILKPFLADHMNEALNPSSYRPTLVRSVRRAVKKYDCDDWVNAYPELTAAALATRSAALTIWHGEDYGWKRKDRKVTIGETCFTERIR